MALPDRDLDEPPQTYNPKLGPPDDVVMKFFFLLFPRTKLVRFPLRLLVDLGSWFPTGDVPWYYPT